MAVPALRRCDNIMIMQDMTAAAALYKTIDGDFELGNSLLFGPDFRSLGFFYKMSSFNIDYNIYNFNNVC